MQATSVLYKSLILQKYHVEYKVEIAGETYNQADIISDNLPQISEALFDKFRVGDAPSATLNISIKPKGTIPDMSMVEVFYRISTLTQNSEWLPKGQFYIDVRHKNNSGILTLDCFDAMLKAEYTFMESGTWTSTTALATVQMIAGDMGVSIEADTLTLLTNDSKAVPFVPVIGENGTTGREMLRAIAAIYGGNFIIDELGQLKLVQLTTPADTHSIGVLAANLDIAPAFDAIDRVILYSGEDKKSGYRSPESTFDSLTGRILEAYCPWTSQELADDLLAIVDGFVYQPLDAAGANIDPAMQLGDGVTVNGTTSMICSAHLKLDARCAADLSAPYEEEINHEYPYRSPAQRAVDNAVTEEELITPGQTQINGANIVTGTITLGGNNNGRGELHILDENDVETGNWDNEGITIYDDSTLSGSLSTDNKLRILRMNDDPDTAFGTLLGVGLYDDQQTYPDYRRPYIILRGKDTRGKARVAMLDAIAGLFLSLTDQSDNSWSVQIRPDTNYVPNPVTRSSGVNPSATLETWGRIAQLTFEFTANATYSANTNIFTGTLVDGYRPRHSILGVGYYGSSVYVGMISPGGTITIRACDAVTFQSQYPAYISWTWIF